MTCDADKQSTNHLLEETGILSLNETCKAHTTQDVLIPGEERNNEAYQDFIPHSLIKDMDQLLNTSETDAAIQTKHLRGNFRDDPNSMAKSVAQIRMERNFKEGLQGSDTKHLATIQDIQNFQTKYNFQFSHENIMPYPLNLK